MKALKKVLILCSFIGAFSSCKKDLLDINVDPNNPTTESATPNYVLSNALNTTAAIYDNSTAGNNNFVWAGLWMGHISYSGNFAIATENISYNLTNSFGQGTWDLLYDNIEDYDFVEQKGLQTGNIFYRAIGTLMKAYNFQTLVDVYNNVPYTEALKGTGNSTPQYDDGKDIYADLSKKIDTAIGIFAQIDTTGTPSIIGDVMFGKDNITGTPTEDDTRAEAALWLQFANTVKLRLLLRQSEKNGAAAQAEAAALTGGFVTEDATVNPGYLNSAGKTNPFWGQNINTSGTYTQTLYRAGGFAVQFYQSNNDPRLGRFFSPLANGQYAGNFFGDQGVPNSQTSAIGEGVLQNYNQDAVVMLAAESYFLQAEAVLRGWINTGETAQQLYEKGVTASFLYLGLTEADAQAYYGQAGNSETTWAAASGMQGQLALIIRQKWAVETFINELEPYNDYRRLHLPADIPLSTSPFSTGVLPARLLYPQREISVNSAAVAAAGTVTPGSKIWWMP